jgi:hypothetical protein
MRFVQEANTTSVFPDKLLQFNLPAGNKFSLPTGQPQRFTPVYLMPHGFTAL